MRAPSFVTKKGKETWIVTPASEPAWRPAAEAWHGRIDGHRREHHEFPNRLFGWEGLSAPPSDAAEPYSLQWFLAIEHQRHGKQARWIPQLLEFGKHAGETLLGLGNGLGTDWLQYARHGAKVIACSPLAAELALIRRNFELRGLGGRFLHAQPHVLPLADASVDVACVTNLLHEVPDARSVVDELYRVLKPGGKVVAVVPAHYNIEYWKRVLWPWSAPMTNLRRLSPWHTHRSEEGKDFSRRRLRKLFARFIEHRVHKRQLRRKELPGLWRWLPVEHLQKLFGRFLIIKAFKPVSVVRGPSSVVRGEDSGRAATRASSALCTTDN